MTAVQVHGQVSMAAHTAPIRARFAANLVEDVQAGRLTHGDARLYLDIVGLTGDREALTVALDDRASFPSYAAAIATLAQPSGNLVGSPCPTCGFEIDPDRSES